ncbi:hypothetical protein ACFC3P_08130 [Enterococcus thailandicus]|uniref:hypothetical protein n=1 Tax=Enterococcus thailandicus TaxID=417368 RepID=UPI0039A58445
MDHLIIRKKMFTRNLLSTMYLFIAWWLFLALLFLMFCSLLGYYSDAIGAIFLLVDFPLTQITDILHLIFALLAIFIVPILIGIVALKTTGGTQ